MAETSGRLYTPEILGLAMELAQFPYDGTFTVAADAKSPTCGSSLSLGLDIQGAAVARIGIRAASCAIGQASAAIMAGAAAGRTTSNLENTAAQFARWLAGDGAPPDWPRAELLLPARSHPARRGAIMLPWKAAVSALSNRHCGG